MIFQLIIKIKQYNYFIFLLKNFIFYKIISKQN